MLRNRGLSDVLRHVLRGVLVTVSLLLLQQRALPREVYTLAGIIGDDPLSLVTDWGPGALNSRGDVGFTYTRIEPRIDAPPTTVQSVAVNRDGIIFDIRRKGEVVAGKELTDVYTYGRDWLNDDDTVLFAARYAPGDELAVFTQDQVLVGNGMTIDGEEISLIPDHFEEFGQVGFNQAGELAFVADIDGIPFLSVGVAVCTTSRIIARAGVEPASNDFAAVASPSINNLGEVLFWARLFGGSGAIVSSTRDVLVRDGDTISGQVIDNIEKFGVSAINDSGSFVFVGSAGGIRHVFTESLIAASTGDVVDGETLSDIRPALCHINAVGEIVYMSDFAGGGSGVISTQRGIIVKTGDEVAGQVMNTFGWVGDLNDNGQIVFDVDFLDGTGALVRATPPPSSAVLELELAVPSEVRLTRANRSQIFRLVVPEGKAALVTLTDPDTADSNVLYLRWGEPPEPGIFDQAADVRKKSSQRLLIPATRNEEAWITVSGTGFHGADNVVTVVAELLDLAVEAFSASYAGQGAVAIQGAIRGAGFTQGLRIALKPRTGGNPIEAEDVLVVSGSRAEAVFPIAGAATGDYDLEVRVDPTLDAKLESAFRIVPTRRGPNLKVELSGSESYRYDRFARLNLRYENVGDEEMPAPLLKIKGPVGSQLRLDAEGKMQDGELLVLGIHHDGLPGVLPPGGKGSVPLVFRSTSCRDCEAAFVVYLFEPTQSVVKWAQLETPAGMSPELWDTARSQLASVLGADWTVFHKSFTEISNRLSRRGVNGASAREITHFVLRQALGRPSGSVLGRAVDFSSGRPLPGISVLAISRKTEGSWSVESVAVTDANGTYALDWLTPGRTYIIALEEGFIVRNSKEIPEVTLSAGEDLYGFDIKVFRGPSDWVSACPACDDSGLSVGPIVPPEAFFRAVASLHVRHISSFDPNDKDGPGDFGDGVYPDEVLRYTIFFENASDASAAAEVVTITDQLDEDLDWETLRFEEINVGNLSSRFIALARPSFDRSLSSLDRFSGYSVPRWASYCRSGKFDISAGLEKVATVKYLAQVDPLTGIVRWTLDSSGDDKLAFSEGFLPPNDKTGRGEGHVTFTIEQKLNLAEGTEFENDAEIEFDDATNRIRTNTWLNVLHSGRSSFIRGDTNENNVVDLSDATETFNDLFLGSSARARCRDALDADDSGIIDISDGVHILTYLFLGGPEILPPFGTPGTDPTEDDLPDCEARGSTELRP